MAEEQNRKADGLIGKIWSALRRPSISYSVGSILVSGVVAGVIFWGGFNTALEVTNTEDFCISCHEMEVNVFEEYKNTIHYNNRTGVRATCPDCHVPKEWHHKVVRKIKASNELFHKVMGTIDTPEKFEAKRLKLAQNVWRSMKATDSRECRNCHDYSSMDFTYQGRRAVAQHSEGLESGKTCIDCHKGIAHSLPDMHDVDPTIVVGQK